MSLVTVVLILVIVALVLYLANRYVPGNARAKQVISAVVILVAFLWLVWASGWFGHLEPIHWRCGRP